MDIICQLNPPLYTHYVALENGRDVLYTKVSKAVYGMVGSVFLFWLELSGFLEKKGYVMNPYDICFMNKMINGAQCTIVWHVDNITASHVDSELLTASIKLMQENYGKHAPLIMTSEKVHK